MQDKETKIKNRKEKKKKKKEQKRQRITLPYKGRKSTYSRVDVKISAQMVMIEGECGSHRRLPIEVNNLTKHGPSSSNGVNGNPFASDGRHGHDGEHLHSLEAVNGTVATSRNNLQVAPSPTSSLSSGKVQSIFDGNCIPFPLLPPSVEKVSPDDVMTFNISCYPTSTNPGKAREVDLVTIFTAAWSLVATRSSGLDGVSFGVR